MRLPDLEAWAMFACVVEHRSFSAAAQAIGVSNATVSKAVSRLEQALGTTLFHRTSRRLTLTDSGQALSQRAARILEEARAAEEQARDAATRPTGLVRIAAPMSFGLSHVADALAAFMVGHPGIEIDLRLSDATVDIVAEGIDVALRIANLPDSSLRARRIASVPVHVVAAPAYLARAGVPGHPSDLSGHACFRYTNLANQVWHFRRGDEEVSIRANGPFASDNGTAMLPMLRAGLGIARLPDFIVADAIRAGDVVPLLTEWLAPPVALHLVTPPGTHRPARVEALLAFLADGLGKACDSRHFAD